MTIGRTAEMATGKDMPPSRGRYEAKKPTFSFRVEKQLKDQLDAYLKEHGISGAEFVREALGVREREIADLDRATNEACEAVYEAAKDRYEVRFRCSACGQLHSIESTEGKRA